MRLAWPFRRDVTRDHAHGLYVALSRQAREPAFYVAGATPDTLAGRFELVLLHAILVVRRLNRAGPQGQALAQVLFDVLFDDMDQALREMGIADLSVAKRVKRLAAAFYGRAKAYEAALDRGPEALADALERNLFASAAVTGEALSYFVGYVAAAEQSLAAQPDAALLAGELRFPPPPA
ncbi:ubiquinol-cytochrome C chaperone family protein [Desertibaculum subflavum]|uniref:ubiquinol-cytochrome C chaperone family protein n=1 Tax=Desertibaculum subflavum TaxID=2268458 RepID=UPI000E676176